MCFLHNFLNSSCTCKSRHLENLNVPGNPPGGRDGCLEHRFAVCGTWSVTEEQVWQSQTQLWDREKARNLIWNQSLREEFLLIPILLIPKEPAAKFLLTSREAEVSSGSTDRMKEIPCPLSYPRYQCLMVFGMHWALRCTWCRSSAHTEEKNPVTVNNKESEEPLGTTALFLCPACHFRDLGIPWELKKLKQENWNTPP